MKILSTREDGYLIILYTLYCKVLYKNLSWKDRIILTTISQNFVTYHIILLPCFDARDDTVHICFGRCAACNIF